MRLTELKDFTALLKRYYSLMNQEVIADLVQGRQLNASDNLVRALNRITTSELQVMTNRLQVINSKLQKLSVLLSNPTSPGHIVIDVVRNSRNYVSDIFAILQKIKLPLSQLRKAKTTNYPKRAENLIHALNQVFEISIQIDKQHMQCCA